MSDNSVLKERSIEKCLAKDYAIMQSPTGQKTTVSKTKMYELEHEGWRRVN